jgi:hypothetical protein
MLLGAELDGQMRRSVITLQPPITSVIYVVILQACDAAGC